jgi:tetratricopeptide (TPR) repeat protein
MSISECENLLTSNRYKKAREMSLDLLYDDPQCERSLEVLFSSSLSLGDDIYAEESLIQLMEINPLKSRSKENELLNQLKLRRAMAERHYSNKLYEHSLESVKIALEVAPETLDLQILKAKCYIRLNMPIVAKVIVEKYLIENPDNDELIFFKGVVLFYLGKLEEGLSFVKQALELQPDQRKYLEMEEKLENSLQPLTNVKMLEDSGKYDEAVAILTETINSPLVHHGWHFELLIRRAKIHKKARNFDMAICDINKAIVSSDHYLDNDSYVLLRAECYLEAENYEMCIDDCKVGLKNSSDPRKEALLKKAEEGRKREVILTNIEENKFKEAFDVSFQHYQESHDMRFFAFAVHCAKEMKNDETVKKLLEMVKDDEETKQLLKTLIETVEEEGEGTPEEFKEALGHYDEGNLAKCIEVLEKAKLKGVGLEKFPESTLQKSRDTLHLIKNGKDS